MKAAVTGGSGFVGSHLVQALRARGDGVAALARTAAAEAALAGQGCRVVRGDLSDPEALRRLADGADVVFHVAGATAALSPDGFRRVNAEGAARMAEAARAAGAGRLLYVSSLSATGPTVPGRPLDEGAPPRPLTAYGRSKLEGERAVAAAGVPFTVVRPPVVYGEGDREMLRLFRLARRGVVPLLGTGAQELSLVQAGELAEALRAAAASPAAQGGTYHAAHPAILTQRSLAEAVARAVGRPVRVMTLPAGVVRPVLAVLGAAARLRGRASVLGPDKAAELLAPAWTCLSHALERDAGWRASLGHEEGLARTARWYGQAGWL